jgi:hypothetical protein
MYHFSVQVIGRSAGRSAVAAAAYRSAEKVTDERTGLVHDYTRKQGVHHRVILLPPSAPRAFFSRHELWNAVEKKETRKNSQTAREIDFALPIELSRKDQIRLARTFVRDVFVKAGMCADLCLHDLHSGNPHAHVMLSTRNVDRDGFTTKNRDWNDKGLLMVWREKWADYANAFLEKRGSATRLDHRSLLDQGITDRLPQIHLGPTRHAMQKKGIELHTLEAQQHDQLQARADIAAQEKITEAKEKAALHAERHALQAELAALAEQEQQAINELNAERAQREAERFAKSIEALIYLREKREHEAKVKADAQADAEAEAFKEAALLAEIEAEKTLNRVVDLGQRLSAIPQRRKAITDAAQKQRLAILDPINALKKRVETARQAANQSKQPLASLLTERKDAHQALQHHLARRHFFIKFLEKVGLKADKTRKKLQRAHRKARKTHIDAKAAFDADVETYTQVKQQWGSLIKKNRTAYLAIQPDETAQLTALAAEEKALHAELDALLPDVPFPVKPLDQPDLYEPTPLAAELDVLLDVSEEESAETDDFQPDDDPQRHFPRPTF